MTGMYVCVKCRKPFTTEAEARTHKCRQMPQFNDPRTSVAYCGTTVLVVHPEFPAHVLDIRNVPEDVWQEVFLRENADA